MMPSHRETCNRMGIQLCFLCPSTSCCFDDCTCYRGNSRDGLRGLRVLHFRKSRIALSSPAILLDCRAFRSWGVLLVTEFRRKFLSALALKEQNRHCHARSTGCRLSIYAPAQSSRKMPLRFARRGRRTCKRETNRTRAVSII